jgi:hypothetical protein
MTNAQTRYRIDGYLRTDDDQPIATLEMTSKPSLSDWIDLRPLCSPVEDQGHVGSCTANAIVGALEYLQIASGGPSTDLSRLFVYYNARRFSDREGDDCGASMAHAMASLLAFGACPESVWPYDEARWSKKPPDGCYQSAVPFAGLHYASVAPNDERKYVLASGLPIIFGMGVPEHLLMNVGAQTGYMPAPADGNWEPASSGHAMLIVGYSDANNAWLVRNSWGTGFGEGGHVWIDYAVMDHYAIGAQDFWTVGPLDRNKFFRLAGPSSQSVQQHAVQHATPATRNFMDQVRKHLRHDLETHLDATRQGLRDRLRGPGVGGGYDKGPGAGGGYDKGPGVGGGYDRGPGAGGGYDD